MAHTHTSGLLSSVLRVFLHLPMQMRLLLSYGKRKRSVNVFVYFSGIRTVCLLLSLLPIFLLAQILMRADLGDEPEHPLEVVTQPSSKR